MWSFDPQMYEADGEDGTSGERWNRVKLLYKQN